MRLIGIFGGTFNPIHFGHLRMAEELRKQLDLDEVRFIPSANPPHKTEPDVSAKQRAEMVELAISDHPNFILETCELNRTGPSYTIDTLKQLYASSGDDALCLIMGTDAFLKFDTWHQWQEILNYCHIVLVQRPSTGTEDGLNETLKQWLSEHYTEDVDALLEVKSGLIHMQAITPLSISSTMIRESIQEKTSIKYLTPNAVIEYIRKKNLY